MPLGAILESKSMKRILAILSLVLCLGVGVALAEGDIPSENPTPCIPRSACPTPETTAGEASVVEVVIGAQPFATPTPTQVVSRSAAYERLRYLLRGLKGVQR